jgi:hypothetical protein
MKMAAFSSCNVIGSILGRWLIPLACIGWLGGAAADAGSLCDLPQSGDRSSKSAATSEHFDYRGRDVAVLRAGEGADERLLICVDGRMWPHDLIARVGDGFTSRLLPFQQFPALPDLIKALIDNDGVLFQI